MAEINGTFIGNVSFQNFILFIFVVILTFALGGYEDCCSSQGGS